MILLDTNVLSEPLKPIPDAAVLTWLGRQVRSSLFTTTVTQAELLFGVCLLPEGPRRSRLEIAVREVMVEAFAGRLIAFDGEAAEAFADIACRRRAVGRPISHADGMIAAIARSRGAVLATRNTTDFEDCGVEVTNPWND